MSDFLVEEIITALSRIHWLFVIARNSSFTYRGQPIDVQRVGRELGVAMSSKARFAKLAAWCASPAQLIHATTGAHLRADRFDATLEAIFDLQDQVALSTASVIEPTLQAAEMRHSAERPTSDLTAYDLFLRSCALARSLRPTSEVAAGWSCG